MCADLALNLPKIFRFKEKAGDSRLDRLPYFADVAIAQQRQSCRVDVRQVPLRINFEYALDSIFVE